MERVARVGGFGCSECGEELEIAGAEAWPPGAGPT
jgi:hypothetical protein